MAISARSRRGAGRPPVTGCADTLTASARTAVAAHPRVVFTGSSSVYGAGEGALIDEGTPATTDADAALDFVVARDLTGVYNAVPDETVPPTNAEAFGEICAAAGLPGLTFRGEIKTPAVPVTSAKLRAAGFAFAHSAEGATG
ncbi:hypothetical protein E1281_04735 [Actinomadura sp. KC345]|uniref:hypothetical protein n=1 Tax=Actinomadura sp. KC345 TaxID=2530371 RepID=UPI00104A56F1|nr:hypothetical protein [Actinomadura sp. KC345]TDC57508.1 hypothetical protein E1281_04735 [Actinomadura sp. KC345]